MTLTIEKSGTDERSFNDVFTLMLALHRAGGFAPLDVNKSAEHVYQALTDEATFLARIDGKPVGALSMVDIPFWYSRSTFLQDKGFFVAPEHRRGQVGGALMQAVREEAQHRGRIAMVTVTNPDRRPKKTSMSLESQIAGFVPLGYTIKLK